MADRTLPLREGEIDQQSAMDDIGGAREGGGGGDGGEGGGKGGGEGGGEGSGWPSTAASLPRLAPSQAWGAGAAAEALPVQGMREPQQGALVRSGGASRGGSDVRIRLGRHAHGEGPGRSRSGPTSIHSRGQAECLAFWRPLSWNSGNPHLRALCVVFVCLSARALHGVFPRDRWPSCRDGNGT